MLPLLGFSYSGSLAHTGTLFGERQPEAGGVARKLCHLALTWPQPRSSPFSRSWGSAGPRAGSTGGGAGSSSCSRHAVPGREELFWWHRCTPEPPRRAPSSRTRSPLGGGWGDEDSEDEAEDEGAESGERPPGGVAPAVPAAVAGPLATGSRCSRMRRRSVDPCSALPAAPPGSRGSGEEQHRLGCEDENTRSSTCFRFLKPLHLLPVLPTPATASFVALVGGGDGVGVAAVRRSWPPVRPPPPPLPLPTPSCRFLQSRAWKEGDAAGSGSPAAAARGSILHPRHLLSPPPASPPTSRAAAPPGARRRRWRRRWRPAQQHKPRVPSGFRPARSKAAVAEALLPPGVAASAGCTCPAGLALSPSARGSCKVSRTELRCSSPQSAPRPRPGSPSAPATGSGSCKHPADAASCTGDHTRALRPAPVSGRGSRLQAGRARGSHHRARPAVDVADQHPG